MTSFLFPLSIANIISGGNSHGVFLLFVRRAPSALCRLVSATPACAGKGLAMPPAPSASGAAPAHGGLESCCRWPQTGLIGPPGASWFQPGIGDHPSRPGRCRRAASPRRGSVSASPCLSGA